MTKEHRYTYDNPPEEVLNVYPNWVQALDEEGQEGQDETTIKPDEVQDYIAESTQHTAAGAVLPDGRKCTVLLRAWRGLHNGTLEGIGVLDADGDWEISVQGNSWQPDQWAAATKFHGDISWFPLHVLSRLPSCATRKRIELFFLPDGSVQQSWQ